MTALQYELARIRGELAAERGATFPRMLRDQEGPALAAWREGSKQTTYLRNFDKARAARGGK